MTFAISLSISREMRLKCWGPFLFCLIFSYALDAHKIDDVFKVYRVFPVSLEQIQLLNRINVNSGEVDFWYETTKPGGFTDVMISSSFEPVFLQLLNKHEITFNITIPDVQQLIIKKEKRKKEDLFGSRLRRTPQTYPSGRDIEAVGNTRAEFRFGEYSSYASMVRYLRTLEFYYPKIVRLIRIGMSHEGRPIEGVKIGFPVSNTTKRAVWIDGNIHAREWASSHTALFIINQLVAGYGNQQQITEYLNELNFYIVPCLNPDGYEYSRSSVLPQIRLWRKNRSPEKCMPTPWGGIRCCQGVDLNRNFDFHWAETGSSDNPCSNLYAGEYAFSEPESHSVSMFLQSNNLRGKLDVFITLHTYAQFWIHPYSHLRRKYPADVDDILDIAEKATKKLKQIYGTEYHVGTGADLLSPAAGGSDDWAKDILGVKYVYLLELRPNNNMKNGFILDRSELLPVGIETLEGLKVIFDSVLIQNATSTQVSAYGLSVNNSLDIRRLPPNTPNNPFNQNSRSTQPSRWNTIYIPRTPYYTTPMTTAVTRSTTATTTTSPPTITTKKNLIATVMTTTKPANAREEQSSVTPAPQNATATTQTVSKVDNQTTTSKERALDILKNLPFETRRQLSGELLKKQLMRIKNLAMMNTTTIVSSTKKLRNAASDLEIPSVLSTQTIAFLTLPPSTPLNSTALPSTVSISRNQNTTTTRQSTQIESTSTTMETSEICVDKKYSCAFWINADKKACHTQKRFMETNCAFSCGYCNKE